MCAMISEKEMNAVMGAMMSEKEMNAVKPDLAVKKPAEIVYVGVRFITGIGSTDTIYTFKCDIPNIAVGDMVLCDTTKGFSVATIHNVDCYNASGRSSKWVVQKVDMDTHRKRVERDYRRQEIRARMDAHKKHLEDMAIYKMMADTDPEMAKLIAEYYET